MIPITCPTCGRRGTIPSDRLNTRMHCKKCDAVFHMDKSGKIMLGEPGAVKAGKGAPGGKGGGASAKGGKPAAKPRKKDEPAFTNASEFLASIPVGGKIAAAVVLGLAALYFSGVFRSRPTDPAFNYKNFRDDLDSRFAFAANMFIDNDPGAIKRIATDGSKDDVDRWMNLVRPMFKFDGPQKPGTRCETQVYMTKGDNNANEAEWTAHIIPPQPYKGPEVDAEKTAKPAKDILTPGYDSAGMFDLPMLWVKDGKVWKLDATKTVQQSEAKLAARKK